MAKQKKGGKSKKGGNLGEYGEDRRRIAEERQRHVDTAPSTSREQPIEEEHHQHKDSVGGTDEENDDNRSTRRDGDSIRKCGIGSCKPEWLQKLHNAEWLLAVLCICAFNQSFVINAIFPVGLSTLEKRFHMSSIQTGIISSWYDLAVLVAVFPVCHWGNYGHKGRWICVGSLIMALGSLLCTLPHFITAPWPLPQNDHSLNTTDYGQCALRSDIHEQCAPTSGIWDHWFMHPIFLVFLLGQTFHGFGATPLFSLGTAYLDENVSQKSSPVYLAIHSLLTSMGPILGLFIGGKLLTIYDDFDRVDMGKLPMKDSKDPHWVGAWWLGFAGCSLASLLISIPIMMFARELPEAKRHRAKDAEQQSSQPDADDEDILKTKNLGLLSKAVWNILGNSTFVAIIVIGIFESIILNGFSAFMPKILETILSTTPTMGSYYSSVVIFAAAAGVMLGGMVVRQLKLQIRGMLRMILACHLAALALISCLLIQCPAREFAGLTTGYSPRDQSLSLDHSCNLNCHCHSKWSPVCDKNTGITYFSACYAGCSSRDEFADIGTVWTDCRCLNMSVMSLANGSSSSSDATFLVDGFCSRDCGWHLWLFLALLFCSVVASFAAGIPTQQIMLRVIPVQQRTLGIAINWTFLRLLGFIPGGIIFGYMIDTTCLKWQESSCGQRENCLAYDSVQLSWTIMALAVICKLVAVLATILGYLTYRPSGLDSVISVPAPDSRAPLSVMVNDDRHPANVIAPSSIDSRWVSVGVQTDPPPPPEGIEQYNR